MLNKIAVKVTNNLLLHNIITRESFDIYVYGFELLISFLFSTTTILFLGTILGCFYQTIAFLMVFILLRSFSGGYHAKTYSMCTIVTFATFGTVLLLSKYIFVDYIAYLTLGAIGIAILAIFAPIEHPNKKTTSDQKRWHKAISLVLFVVFISAGIWMITVQPVVGNTVFYSLIADLLLLFIKNRKGKEKNHEVQQRQNQKNYIFRNKTGF